MAGDLLTLQRNGFKGYSSSELSTLLAAIKEGILQVAKDKSYTISTDNFSQSFTKQDLPELLKLQGLVQDEITRQGTSGGRVRRTLNVQMRRGW